MNDRGDHRAHKYERQARTATSQMLAPDDVAVYLKTCQQIVGDIRRLSSNSSFDALGYDARPTSNYHAEDVVDLILCGPFNWIVQHDPSEGHAADVKYYWRRRRAYYERLHSEHARRGVEEEPFNALRRGTTRQ